MQIGNRQLQIANRPCRFLLLAIVFSLPSVFGANHSAAKRAAIDQDYIAALAAANRFLQAWQNQDHETAILLLTDTLKQHTNEQALETFFIPAAHAQQAYEISSGKKLAPGRYIFTVKLFNSAAKSLRQRPSQLVVTRAGKNDWAIDKLP